MSYKVLWYSIYALHDTTNGAAIHNKILLESLVKRGIEVKVVNGIVADDPRGLAIFERIAETIHADPKKNYMQFTDKGVEYFVIKTKGKTSKEITHADQIVFFDIVTQLFEQYQPDMFMGYSGDFFSSFMRREAHARGIKTAYALCNGLHLGFSFSDCDLIFTPSQATANLYREREGMDVKAVGQFIDPETVLTQQREPKYVTLVNPTPEKGLAIFIKLVEQMRLRRPELQFLVVKSVGDYNAIMRALHNSDGSPYLTAETQAALSIDVAEHTNDIRQVYALTKVLVAPSVWHEAWGCVATEAVMNGIPVLTTTSGGLPEATGEGGLILKAPESTQKDFYCVPSTEEIMPFVEALERLLDEDWTERCQRAAQVNGINNSVDRLLAYLQPLMDECQKTKTPREHSYYFNDAYLARRR